MLRSKITCKIVDQAGADNEICSDLCVVRYRWRRRRERPALSCLQPRDRTPASPCLPDNCALPRRPDLDWTVQFEVFYFYIIDCKINCKIIAKILNFLL